MAIWNIIFTALFILWMFTTAYIGWKILDQGTKQTQKLLGILIDTVVTSSNAAKQSSENAQKVIGMLEKRLKEHADNI